MERVRLSNCGNCYRDLGRRIFRVMALVQGCWNELKKEVGYVDVTNQYIELAKRYYEKECIEKDLQISARQVGLNISQLPE